MKALRNVPALSLLMFSVSSFGQQLPLLSSYSINPQLTNPAFTGLHGNNVYVLNRSQWQSNTNSPQTFLASYNGSLKKGRSGYGLVAYNDAVNVVSRSGISGTFVQRWILPDNALLSLGASAIWEQTRLLNGVNPEVPVELGLPNNNAASRFDANLGLAYQISGLHLGIAGYRLFDNNPVQVVKGDPNDYHYQLSRHWLGSLSYRYMAIPGLLSVDPVLRVRMASGLDPQTDFTLLGNYKDKYSLGASYRQQYGFDVLASATFRKKFSIAYTYAVTTVSGKSLPGHAHELILGYKFGAGANPDSDKDGVEDLFDKEPKTMAGCAVDKSGIAMDTDRDNIPDCRDRENNTPYGAPVDNDGVAMDSDKDKVIDLYDQEPDSPAGFVVDKTGIAMMPELNKPVAMVENEPKPHKLPAGEIDETLIDTDNDNVPDITDREPETPHWMHIGGRKNFDASKCIVDLHGEATDSDGDGVMDCVDEEIFSPKGAKVNKNGIANADPSEIIPEKAVDTDGDGISDDLDLEPNTPKGATIDQWGRSPQVNPDPAAVHRIAVSEIEDHSDQWEYYVIIGVFRYYNNLKNYQKYLLKTYNEESHVLVTDQNYYYAWTKQVRTREEAESEVQRLSSKRLKDYIVGNPWLWREEKKK